MLELSRCCANTVMLGRVEHDLAGLFVTVYPDANGVGDAYDAEEPVMTIKNDIIHVILYTPFYS